MSSIQRQTNDDPLGADINLDQAKGGEVLGEIVAHDPQKPESK